MISQTDRLIRYLRAHPGATPMQLVTDLRMPKYTSRISDARDRGVIIECRKVEGVSRYYVREARPEPITGIQIGAFG